MSGNEPYEVTRAKLGAASGLDGLISRAPRGIAYPPLIQSVARAIEEGLYRRASEDDIYEQCRRVVHQQMIDGDLRSAEAEEWEKVAFQTVEMLCMTRGPGERLREEARLSYEKALKDIHGLDSEPILTPEGERIVREQREDRYWDICQRLASTRAGMCENRVFETYWLAKSLEKTDPSQAIELYSKFAAAADSSRLGGYVLSAFERMSLLHERAQQYPEALEAIARYEETAQEGHHGEFWVPKGELMAIQKRKVRILAKLARRSGPTCSTVVDRTDRAS